MPLWREMYSNQLSDGILTYETVSMKIMYFKLYEHEPVFTDEKAEYIPSATDKICINLTMYKIISKIWNPEIGILSIYLEKNINYE